MFKRNKTRRHVKCQRVKCSFAFESRIPIRDDGVRGSPQAHVVILLESFQTLNSLNELQ